MATKIQVRRDTAANWAAVNPVLAAGEPGLETDTSVVKYGDGISTWANLATPPSGDNAVMKAWSGNNWEFKSSSGGKSFIFKTEGHVRTNVRVTASQTIDNSTGFVVRVSEHPNIVDSVKIAWDGWNDGYQSQPYFYINGDWAAHVDHYTLDGDVMTIYSEYSYSLNVNDMLQFAGWNYGTQAVFNTYVSDFAPTTAGNLAYDGSYWQPAAAVSNTNVFTVDLSNMDTDNLALLTNGSGKNYVVFDSYNNNDGHRISSVTNSGNTYTITVTGEPVTLKKKTAKVLNCKPAVNATNNYRMYLSTEEYPQLIDYLNIDDNSVYLTINGGSPIPVYYFWPRGGNDSENDGVTYYGNWALGTETQMTYTTADTVELHYIEKGTFIRFDLWSENGGTLGDPHPSNSNYGYRWFSWDEDLPHFKDARGNGVQGGWLDYHVQATWPDTSSRNWDNRTFSVFFDPKGYDNDTGDITGLNNFRYQGFPTNSGPAQPDVNGYHGGAFGGPWYDLTFQTMWDFYEDGIFFHAYNFNYDNGTQQEVKIDIMWNARIFYADTPMLEPNDR